MTHDDDAAALGLRLQQLEGGLALAQQAFFELLVELTQRGVIASDWIDDLSQGERAALVKRMTPQGSYTSTPGGIKTWN